MATESSEEPEESPDPQDEEPSASSEQGEAPGAELEAQGEVLEGEIADEVERRIDRRFEARAASFRGPLPPPETLRGYDDVLPGLAREIVDQWKGETEHRRQTINYLTETDRIAMTEYYSGFKRGQYLSIGVFAGVLAIAIVAIVLHSTPVGVVALVSAAATVIWALRRSPEGPSLGPGPEPTDLADGDAVEKPAEADQQ